MLSTEVIYRDGTTKDTNNHSGVVNIGAMSPQQEWTETYVARCFTSSQPRRVTSGWSNVNGYRRYNSDWLFRTLIFIVVNHRETMKPNYHHSEATWMDTTGTILIDCLGHFLFWLWFIIGKQWSWITIRVKQSELIPQVKFWLFRTLYFDCGLS